MESAEDDQAVEPVQDPEDSAVDRLQAELEASLSAGFAPDGWERRISWPSHGTKGFWIAGAGSVLGLVAAWVAWGWKAGLAALVLVIGLALLASWRSGPRVGDEITESFTPPDEVLLNLGIAGHELLTLQRSRPTFSVNRQATPADRRNVRLGAIAMGAILVVDGGLVLLLESDRISPSTFLRSGAIVSAAVLTGLALWAWRRMGLVIRAFGPRPDRDPTQDTDEDLLDVATSGGGAVDALVGGVLSRLPLPVARVVTVAILLLVGALGVLVAFNVAPDESELWSSLTAGADLLLFLAAGARALILLAIGLVRRDRAPAVAGVQSLVLMGGLLLAAMLFGWLDEWRAVISWVLDRVA